MEDPKAYSTQQQQQQQHDNHNTNNTTTPNDEFILPEFDFCCVAWKRRTGFAPLVGAALQFADITQTYTINTWEPRTLTIQGQYLCYYENGQEDGPPRGMVDILNDNLNIQIVAQTQQSQQTQQTNDDNNNNNNTNNNNNHQNQNTTKKSDVPSPHEVDIQATIKGGNGQNNNNNNSKPKKIFWRFCFDLQEDLIQFLANIHSVLDSGGVYQPKDTDRFEHDFSAGDHIYRWEMICVPPVIYPIQIHGIVLEAGRNCIVVADFGLTGYSKKQGQEFNHVVDDRHSNVLVQAWKKLRPEQDQRLNIVTIIDPKEIRIWMKARYDEESFLNTATKHSKVVETVGNWFGKLKKRPKKQSSTTTTTTTKTTKTKTTTEGKHHHQQQQEEEESFSHYQEEEEEEEDQDPYMIQASQQSSAEQQQTTAEASAEQATATTATTAAAFGSPPASPTKATGARGGGGGIGNWLGNRLRLNSSDLNNNNNNTNTNTIATPTEYFNTGNSRHYSDNEDYDDDDDDDIRSIDEEEEERIRQQQQQLNKSPRPRARIGSWIASFRDNISASRSIDSMKDTDNENNNEHPLTSAATAADQKETQSNPSKSSVPNATTTTSTSTTTTTTAKPEPVELPQSDPVEIVLARANYLLEHMEVIPPYHVFYSNSECIAVWCKTGRWSTLQTAVFLSTNSVGAAKSSTLATIGVAAANPFLAPVVALGGLVWVTAPMVILKKSREKWEENTKLMTDLFWSAAPPRVYVAAIQNWSGIGATAATTAAADKKSQQKQKQEQPKRTTHKKGNAIVTNQVQNDNEAATNETSENNIMERNEEFNAAALPMDSKTAAVLSNDEGITIVSNGETAAIPIAPPPVAAPPPPLPMVPPPAAAPPPTPTADDASPPVAAEEAAEAEATTTTTTTDLSSSSSSSTAAIPSPPEEVPPEPTAVIHYV